MPYITKHRASFDMKKNPKFATAPGDLNYLYTLEFVRMWKAAPCYATFHTISKCEERPETDQSVFELTRSLLVLWTPTDLKVARKEALAEFRRRIMVHYETMKSQDENNVDPYKEDTL